MCVSGEGVDYFLSNALVLKRLEVHESPKLVHIRVSGKSLVLKHFGIGKCRKLESVEGCHVNIASLDLDDTPSKLLFFRSVLELELMTSKRSLKTVFLKSKLSVWVTKLGLVFIIIVMLLLLLNFWVDCAQRLITFCFAFRIVDGLMLHILNKAYQMWSNYIWDWSTMDRPQMEDLVAYVL